MTVLTIRDVPEDVRDVLASEAREQGQSLQAFLLALVKQRAAFNRNLEILDEVERDLAAGGGAGQDAPSSADLIRAARAERDEALYRALTGEPLPESARDPLLRDSDPLRDSA